MTVEPQQGIFFAYASQPPLRAETMRQVIDGLTSRGIAATGWESLSIDGRVLIDTITERIDASKGVVAEISSMNFNVLFELGYAIATNKPAWLAYDETDTDAAKAWMEVAIFATIGRTDYGGSAEQLISKIAASSISETIPLADTILAGAKPRAANAIFAPALPIKLTAATNLSKLLDRKTHLNILAASEDLMIAPLEFYASEIYRSSAVIIHLLGAQRRRSNDHNARASFLAGFAHGLKLPLLMVVQSGFEVPLDYRNLLFQYETSAKLTEKVETWLESIPKAYGTQRRLGRLELDIELPLRSFGQYVAEYETEELEDYFVQTSEFSAIIDGAARIFAGRKGTGKTATMSQVAKELSRDRATLVVSMKPSSYEFSNLISALQRFTVSGHAEYFLTTVWMYLIETEIALHVVEISKGRPLSFQEEKSLKALEILLNQMGLSEDDDLSDRLERVVGRVINTIAIENATDPSTIARALRTDHLNKIRSLSRGAASHFGRICVLIDNLDKNWESGADFSAISHFIRSLLENAGRIEKELGRSHDKKNEEVRVTLAVFLRTDILDIVQTYAREPDKTGARTVDWTDEQLLVRVLEERYAVNSKRRESSAMWTELFASEVHGLTARDYFLWRSLRRPRDFIYFANAALTTAINRKHLRIDASDIVYAEREYSRFAIEALLVESQANDFDLEEILYEFAGLSATLNHSELNDALASVVEDVPRIQSWLTAASFLGIEVSEGQFEYVEGQVASRRKTRVALRNSETSGRQIRYRIHPAFRPYLEIRDDDLHE